MEFAYSMGIFTTTPTTTTATTTTTPTTTTANSTSLPATSNSNSDNTNNNNDTTFLQNHSSNHDSNHNHIHNHIHNYSHHHNYYQQDSNSNPKGNGDGEEDSSLKIDRKDKKKHKHGKSSAASSTSSITTASSPTFITTTKSRIPGRRRAASAATQALFQKASSSHRPSSSSASSRASHESQAQTQAQAQAQAQHPLKTTQAHPVSHLASLLSSSPILSDGNDVAAATASSSTIKEEEDSTPASTPASSVHTSLSTPAPASERLPASPKTPRFIRSGHIPIFGNYHRQHQHRHSSNSLKTGLHKRDPYDRRSINNLHLPPTPTSPKRTAPFWDGPLPPFPFESKYYDIMPPEPGTGPYIPPSNGSSASGTTSSDRTVMTSNENLPPSSAEGSVTGSSAASVRPRQSVAARPFITRNNRVYINEPTLLYPLPVDLQELHRQSLRTLLLFQLFGGPTTAPEFSNKPPTRVLEVGCGSAFWSMMCHRYFAQHGHSSISFTGIDIVPLVGSTLEQNWKPDKDMRWRFVQHDVRRMPWPFADHEFDLVLIKDLSMVYPSRDPMPYFEEYLRILKPGGVLEIWETDNTIRMLRPHVLRTPSVAKAVDDSDSDSDSDDEDDTARLGAYVMTNNTPLSAPMNPFLVEYNGWATKALDARGLTPVPCTIVGPYLLQESETLMDVRSKRLAVPLSEIRWEREGVGGVVTKDGKSYIDSMKGKARAPDTKGGEKSKGKTLTATQAALRRTALETTVGLILCLEPLLREASGKSQDEWDSWAGKMMNDLLREGGTSLGECLEVGAWCARKKLTPAS
ncbi:hypothetical protein F4779DRAFT_631608 [Xylariaceae sp. FL0662B]|nr:hypothetical protein F4779DRAFT_631608 [Xylariaceae sp. FL0662B]